MAKYRKKPIVIEAVQWKPKKGGWPGMGRSDILGVIWRFGPKGKVCSGIMETLEGVHEVTIGDWIITGIKGEKYPCKPDIFEATYEKVK